MPAKPSSPEIPLPRGWPSQVKSAVLHVISLGQCTLAYTRGWAANSPCSQRTGTTPKMFTELILRVATRANLDRGRSLPSQC